MVNNTVIYTNQRPKTPIEGGMASSYEDEVRNTLSNFSAEEQETRPGMLVGLVGAPGIGKNYIMNGLMAHKPDMRILPRITTREPRPSDQDGGVIAVSDEQFNDWAGHIVAEHRPFNDHRRYGWYINGSMKELQEGAHFITDPNVEHLGEFHDLFGDKMVLVGLVANPDYLASNLRNRRMQETGKIILSAEEELDISTRLAVGIESNQKILNAHEAGLLHHVVEVSFANRDHIVDVVKETIEGKASTQERTYAQPAEGVANWRALNPEFPTYGRAEAV